MSRAWLLTVLLGVGCATPGGRALPAPASCDGGSQCPSGCVDLTRSAEHCGACDNKCKSGESCRAGSCIVGCVGSTTLCGGTCVDTSSSVSYCGSCMTACDVGDVCVGGKCTRPCPTGQTSCGGDLGSGCADLQTDVKHCGSCAVACDQGYGCSGGNCLWICTPPQTACMNLYCANLLTDVNNCGACGNVCGSGTTCVPSGTSAPSTCKIVCPSGQTLCGSSCFDLQTNASHCGGCNTVCGVTQGCVGGSCLDLCANSALSATASTSGGGSGSYGPTAMNNGVGPSCSAFTWINNGSSPAGKWLQLSWSSNIQVGGFYLQTDNSSGSTCGTVGRNLNGATVQWWNGSAWVTAGAISGQTGTNVRYDFPTPVTTSQVRLYDVVSSAGNGNTLIFEWYVYPVSGCTPP